MPSLDSLKRWGRGSHLGATCVPAGVAQVQPAPAPAGVTEPSGQGAAHKGRPELAPFPGVSFVAAGGAASCQGLPGLVHPGSFFRFPDFTLASLLSGNKSRHQSAQIRWSLWETRWGARPRGPVCVDGFLSGAALPPQGRVVLVSPRVPSSQHLTCLPESGHEPGCPAQREASRRANIHVGRMSTGINGALLSPGHFHGIQGLVVGEADLSR